MKHDNSNHLFTIHYWSPLKKYFKNTMREVSDNSHLPTHCVMSTILELTVDVALAISVAVYQ